MRRLLPMIVSRLIFQIRTAANVPPFDLVAINLIPLNAGTLLVVAARARRRPAVLGASGSAQCGRAVCIAVRIAVVRM
jgi:hypothetical protein